MKPTFPFRSSAMAAIGSCTLALSASAAPTPFSEGITIGPNVNSILIPFSTTNPARDNISLTNTGGGLYLYSGQAESTRNTLDGGITLRGNPVNIVLQTGTTAPAYNTGTFAVWGASSYAGSPYNLPLFKIDNASGASTFTNSNVAINNGSLKINGESVLTSSSPYVRLGKIMPGDSFDNSPYASPPTGGLLALGTSVARGDGAVALGFRSWASGFTAVALGSYSSASGDSSVALGTAAFATGGASMASGNFSNASGDYSNASGWHATASGYSSIASGSDSFASGMYSSSLGLGTNSRSVCETVVGAANNISGIKTYDLATSYHTYLSPQEWQGSNVWIETDAIFRIGNGTYSPSNNDEEYGYSKPYQPSDAMTVLKNGQTTLTNKAWKANVANDPAQALADPPATATDSGGNALVVDGHTVLNGKVTMAAPQGDISMGDYQ